MKHKNRKKLASILRKSLIAATVGLVLGTHAAITLAEGDVYTGPPELPATSQAMPTDRIIVRLREQNDGLANAQQRSHKLQALSVLAAHPLTYSRAMSGRAHVLQLPEKLPLENINAVIERLRHDPDVESAEPDFIMQMMQQPNDTYYGYQWHYHAAVTEPGSVNLPAAWDVTTGDANVVVAVIDTGILPHADLGGRVLPGYDFISTTFVSNDGDGRDSNATDAGDWAYADQCYAGSPASISSWHGTHVAGTIGAATNNAYGLSGINWVSKILPVRVLGRCGGYTSDIVDGMRWAAGLPVSGVPANPTPAKVLNLSLGGGYSCSATSAFQIAINDVTAAGALVVAAAGNSNMDAASFSPAGCSGVVTVAAGNRSGGKSYYSNWGSSVEITAPGGESPLNPNGILSTLDSGTTSYIGDNSYYFYQGTSMAAPHVAGVASLVLSAHYQASGSFMSPQDVASKLQSTARPFPAGSSCNTSLCGAGLLDAAAAVQAVSSAPVVNAGADTSVNAGDVVGLNGTASDDGAISSVSWHQTGGSLVTLTNATTLNASFTAPVEGGDLSFRLTVTDDIGLTSSDSVVVSVIPAVINQAPVSNSASYTTQDNVVLTGTLSANDPEGDTLSYHIVSNPQHGSVVLTNAATGTFEYTPVPGATVNDSFGFYVTDGVNNSNIAQVDIAVTVAVTEPVNNAPVAYDGAVTTLKETPVNGMLSATDADGDQLSFSVITPPVKGTLTITNASTGTFTYTPYARKTGGDSFSFSVSDGKDVSNTASVGITITKGGDGGSKGSGGTKGGGKK